ncbi:bactofilin family protein [Spirochaeta isovalerica]|uniref:Cytoskeletal protein CcmA (Bactofilin family) n=1 Tax=Spirochaeta isovalerica TaxID=150 RepID=A0A841RDY6_9SPIO|nr:polymer-forming cytoskeletal protein [Spirochaeta isovalerica]MBB6480838.1 cytoskeletal protein CcmA (bactofilin family) [Spirochaeta isovalerica]
MTENNSTVLGSETSFKGTMRFNDSLKIDGFFEGNIESDGFLYIEKDAEVRAQIKVRTIIVGGKVIGNIEASEKLEMLESGKIFGNIRTPNLKVAEGVEFDGECEMIRNPEDIDIFSATVSQLKQSVKSV